MSSAENLIFVDDEALDTALHFIRAEKETACDAAQQDILAEWRAVEKDILIALAGLGLRAVEPIEA